MTTSPHPVFAFGEQLLRTGDLDPMYVLLRSAELDKRTLRRWCVGYWLFYRADVATQLANHPGNFWGRAQELASLSATPRGSERRHFRGKLARTIVERLGSRFFSPVEAVTSLHGGGRTAIPVELVRARIEADWYGFGNWISFKMADMLDAVLDCPVTFGPGTVLYKSPVVAAQQLHCEWWPMEPMPPTQVLIDRVTKRLAEHLGHLPVPHAPGRKSRLQEWETVLCKWKSHQSGHYPPGKDTRELLHVLEKSQHQSDLHAHLYHTAAQCLPTDCS